MKERAHLFGGSVSIHGEPGKGTTVVVKIPLQAEGKEITITKYQNPNSK
jgi:signal transduction histidine kinase